ncbi:hypothetical protein ACI6PS_03500 [Flavobacterium sp. PLA-1-15]|uniref:hypothetical protein n=1 Tax=Flavobacterium sp. PLA-1-15 TaxID=3380533 RepID=UPI003B782EF3
MPVFEKGKSRVKMVVLRSGKHPPITWWSIIDKDNQKVERICESMLRRFNNYLGTHPMVLPTINKIHFYEWGKFIGEATVN